MGLWCFVFRCICCPQETKHAEDIKLRAILDRLDDLEVKLLDHPKSHVTGISLSSDHEEDHVVFSETSDLFEGVRQRGKMNNKTGFSFHLKFCS